ncbi:hypothetical protein DPMN_086840 [Dreissena polymorpha]|uniref:Uncharacterized protein n=1 Tax=Dreissena polymorpha TaxID=45954 RepID=A0A9D4KRM0_DREPO|nr:hypothetical protein DPMN_086840 [Dreissena polymorpha]
MVIIDLISVPSGVKDSCSRSLKTVCSSVLGSIYLATCCVANCSNAKSLGVSVLRYDCTAESTFCGLKKGTAL